MILGIYVNKIQVIFSSNNASFQYYLLYVVSRINEKRIKTARIEILLLVNHFLQERIIFEPQSNF